jgi:lysophospholipase L1-like esterase
VNRRGLIAGAAASVSFGEYAKAGSLYVPAVSTTGLSGGFNSYNMRHAIAGMRALGTSRMRIACLGDSVTAGYVATVPGNEPTTAYPAILSAYLQSLGIATRMDSGAFAPVVAQPGDTRFVIGTSWVTTNNTNGATPIFLRGATGALATTFTPTGTVDTFDLWYFNVNNGATFTWSIDGGSQTTVTTTNAHTFVKVTIPCGSIGNHTLSILPTSASQVYMFFVEGYASTVFDCSILNVGFDGSRATGWSPTLEGTDAIGTFAHNLNCPLNILQLGINDIQGAVTTTQFNQAITNIAQTLQANGQDVVLMVPNPISGQTIGIQVAYQEQQYNVAQFLGIPWISVYNLFGQNYVTSNTKGYMSNSLHPSVPGYAYIGNYVGRTISAYIQ